MYYILIAEVVKVLRGAITGILLDDSFTLPTSELQTCLKSARMHVEVLVTCKDLETANQASHCHVTFAEWLVTALQEIFEESKPAEKIKQEKLWSNFHKFRSSKEFTASWEKYLSQIHIDPEPMYYQHVTEEVFEVLIEKQCKSTKDDQETSETIKRMSFEEENAVRFVGGYVIKILRDAQKLPKDKPVVDILNSLVYSKEDERTGCGSQTWINSINRGGLTEINDDAYQVFLSIEYAVRQHMRIENSGDMDSTFRSRLTNMVVTNDDVQFYWCLTGDMEEEVGEMCLEMIVSKWITIRGFSFAASIMEQYKQLNKKGTAKSKSLRTKLFTEA